MLLPRPPVTRSHGYGVHNELLCPLCMMHMSMSRQSQPFCHQSIQSMTHIHLAHDDGCHAYKMSNNINELMALVKLRSTHMTHHMHRKVMCDEAPAESISCGHHGDLVQLCLDITLPERQHMLLYMLSVQPLCTCHLEALHDVVYVHIVPGCHHPAPCVPSQSVLQYHTWVDSSKQIHEDSVNTACRLTFVLHAQTEICRPIATGLHSVFVRFSLEDTFCK